MPLKRNIKSLKSKIGENETRNRKRIKTLQITIEKNKKQHKALLELLKCQYEKELEECEDEVKIWKRQSENLTNLLEKDKREHEEKVFVLDQLKEKLECPVCLDIPRGGPVYICPNGHFVCKTCKTGSCPTCRTAMGNGKSLLAVTIIENIDHQCKFVDCEKLFALDKLEDHEKICKHRTVYCPYGSCSEKIGLSKLLDHLNINPACSASSVPTVIENSSISGKVSFKLNSESDFARSEMKWPLSTFSFQEINFALYPQKYENFYYFAMVMFESAKVCSKYSIEMEVHELNSSSKDSEVRYLFRGNPCSIDENKEEFKYLGLAVNYRGMEKIMRKSCDNSFTLSFAFTEK